MENQGSFYDGFPEHKKVEIKKKTIAPNNQSHLYEEQDQPFANRHDLAQPYSSEFNKKCTEAKTDSNPKTSARYEWALLIANRDSTNPIAAKVNLSFVRNNITGINFKEEKARYLSLYKNIYV